MYGNIHFSSNMLASFQINRIRNYHFKIFNMPMSFVEALVETKSLVYSKYYVHEIK